MPTIHLEARTEFIAHLESNGHLRGCVLQGLDLTDERDRLLDCDPAGAVFLGCQLHEGVVLHLLAKGATVFPDLGPDRPYNPTRGRLYTIDELLEGFSVTEPGSFADSADMAIYRHFQAQKKSRPIPLLESLSQRLHDHAIDDALEALLHPSHGPQPKVVAIMGGHAMKRNQPEFANVVRIAAELTRRGYFIASGGGPGAMEAANLGAYLSPHGDHVIDEALRLLSPAPDYATHAYLVAGRAVREAFPSGAASLAIPTWFYGHEPSNQFATHIAKYFSNSLREDGLLAIATHGVIYAPGSAGTVQEVFMDAAQNHYGTFEWVSPMVFLGRDFWSEERPVLDLLHKLGKGRQYVDRIAAFDEVDEVVSYIAETPPVAYAKG